MKLYSTLIATLLLTGSLQAQVISLPLSETTTPLDGLLYALPKTQLDITVTVRRTKQTPGPYALYAERYLGINEVIQSEQISHELVKITANPVAVPDTKLRYVIMPDPKAKEAPTISLSPEGFLLGCNVDIQACHAGCQPANRPKKSTETPEYQAKASSTFTRDMQQATSTAKLAELAAAQLFNLRETRLSLLHQETEHTPADGASYKLLLAEINRMETYYLELFTGSTETVETQHRLTFEPKKEEEVVLCRFNRQQGLVDKNDLSGEPVLINVSNTYAPALESVKRSIDKKAKPVGLYYRMPALTTINIADDQRVYWKNTVQVAQLGSVSSLPSNQTRSAALCPLTGALLKAGL